MPLLYLKSDRQVATAVPPRFDLVKKYPTYADRKAFWRLPTRYQSIQATNHSAKYPLVFTSGRLVEYEGGGEEERSDPWLAKLRPEMFAEVNPKDAADAGIMDGQYIWLEGAEGGKIKVRALITKRVGPGTVFTPFHFGGWFEGKDLYDRYPEGTAPYVRGEAVQHGDHLWLRFRDADAGNESNTLPDIAGLIKEANHGQDEIPLRRRTLHRLQRLRHGLQERA